MGTGCYSRVCEYAKADRAFFVVFDHLGKDILEPDSIFRRDANGWWLGISMVLSRSKLFQVVGRNEARMQRKLAHASQHGENITSNLWVT